MSLWKLLVTWTFMLHLSLSEANEDRYPHEKSIHLTKAYGRISIIPLVCPPKFALVTGICVTKINPVVKKLNNETTILTCPEPFKLTKFKKCIIVSKPFCTSGFNVSSQGCVKSCMGNRTIIDNSCFGNCPKNFERLHLNICVSKYYGCSKPFVQGRNKYYCELDCKHSSQTKCKVCRMGYRRFANGRCTWICPFSFAVYDSSCIKIDKKMQKCPPGFLHVNSIKFNYCQFASYGCPKGFTRNGQSCLIQNPGESGSSLKCPKGKFKYDSTCVSTCPTGYEGVNKQCVRMTLISDKCPAKYLKLMSFCVSVCPLGYSTFNNVSCAENLSCDDHKIAHQGKCVKKCPDGYKTNKGKTKCMSNLSCRPTEIKVLPFDSYPYCHPLPCPRGYRLNYKMKQCTLRVKCPRGFYHLNDFCFSVCPLDYRPFGMKCFEISRCPRGLMLSGGKCVQHCNTGYIKVKGKCVKFFDSQCGLNMKPIKCSSDEKCAHKRCVCVDGFKQVRPNQDICIKNGTNFNFSGSIDLIFAIDHSSEISWLSFKMMRLFVLNFIYSISTNNGSLLVGGEYFTQASDSIEVQYLQKRESLINYMIHQSYADPSLNSLLISKNEKIIKRNFKSQSELKQAIQLAEKLLLTEKYGSRKVAHKVMLLMTETSRELKNTKELKQEFEKLKKKNIYPILFTHGSVPLNIENVTSFFVEKPALYLSILDQSVQKMIGDLNKTCPVGFTRNTKTKKCEDINECTTKQSKPICQPPATCFNYVGSYVCWCLSGNLIYNGTHCIKFTRYITQIGKKGN